MKFHLLTKRCELTPSAQRILERHLERLERRLRYYEPDLVHLELAVERHARRNEYTGSIRLRLGSRVLPAKRNRAETLEGLLNAAFEDLEEQLDRFQARVRREYVHERKRASLPPEVVRAHERELLEERELLDRALAGDREAFDRLVARELPGLRRVIERELVGSGAGSERVEHVLADTLAIAFRELVRKPARWTMAGWLAWIARREIERERAGVAVAQSVEEPV